LLKEDVQGKPQDMLSNSYSTGEVKKKGGEIWKSYRIGKYPEWPVLEEQPERNKGDKKGTQLVKQ
jgi:hypothetical protein